MPQKIGTLRLALTFAGCFLGAGYVSGQELWQYFGAFGARGLLGLVLAVALLGGTGVLLLRLSARTGIETMDALIVRADIPWLRTVVGVLTAALLFGVVCIMAAGIGALGEQMLGLPVWLGAAIACVLIAAAAYFGLGGMVSVFTVAVPCMIVAALVIAGIRLHRTGLTAAAFAAGDTNPMLGNWATSAMNYAAYNFFATVGILAPLTRHLKKPGTAVWGTVLGCVLLLAVYMGLAYLGATVSAQYTSEIGRAQLVMAIVEALMGKTAETFDADGLELGPHAPEVDPDRVPAKAPAGKKEKKRRRKATARAKAERSGDSRRPDAAPKAPQGPKEDAPKPSRRRRGGFRAR